MSSALKTSTALAARGLPFEVNGGSKAEIPVARAMVRTSGIGMDPFDAAAAIKHLKEVKSGAPLDRFRWSLPRVWPSCSIEDMLALSCLCAVVVLLATRFRGMRKNERQVTGVATAPYGTYLSCQGDENGCTDQ